MIKVRVSAKVTVTITKIYNVSVYAIILDKLQRTLAGRFVKNKSMGNISTERNPGKKINMEMEFIGKYPRIKSSGNNARKKN